MTAGLLINPHSGRSNGKGVKLARMVEGKPGVLVRTIDSFAEVGGILGEFAAGRRHRSLHQFGRRNDPGNPNPACRTQALHERSPSRLLPHGTTNMTAADLGFRHRNLATQAAFIQAPGSGLAQTRPTLRVVNPRDGRFVTACSSAPARSGRQPNSARRPFTRLASRAISPLSPRSPRSRRGAVQQGRPDDPERIDRPYADQSHYAHKTCRTAISLLMLATTLDKLILGTRPFWGGKHGPIRVTTLPYPVPNIPRWLLPLMYGSEQRAEPAGAASFSAARMRDRELNAIRHRRGIFRSSRR